MKTLNEIEDRKKDIVERYGLFMEKSENFAPISARIFSTLLMVEKKGATFEYLVHFLGASKSTISTNLHKLGNMNVVEFYTKPGDRKKYFRLSPVGFIAFLDQDLAKFKAESALVEEVIDFKKDANKIIEGAESKFILHEDTPYLDYINNSIKGLEHLKEKIRTKCMITNK